jgi:hypothetical protein
MLKATFAGITRSKGRGVSSKGPGAVGIGLGSKEKNGASTKKAAALSRTAAYIIYRRLLTHLYVLK